MSAIRYSIWGRWMGSREVLLQELEPYQNRDDELAQAQLDYGEHWELQVHGFPVEHPHAALQRRLSYVSQFQHNDKPAYKQPGRGPRLGVGTSEGRVVESTISFPE